MKKEIRISEIMKEYRVDRDTAEAMFEEELKNRYGTNDLKLATEMFYAD